MSIQTDTIDLGDIVRSVRRGWKEVVGTVVLGTLIAGGVLLWAPRKFESTASLVIKESDQSSSLLSKLGVSGDVSALLPSGTKSSLETEMEVLRSRALAGRLVDSLNLEVQPDSPNDLPATAFVTSTSFPEQFKKRTYQFTRSGNGYAVVGKHDSATAVPGAPAKLALGTITLRADTALPQRFALTLLDREDAITYVQKHLVVEKLGGEAVKVQYRAGDSLTAARVPNALAVVYLARRQTTDRGTNAHRVDFLENRSDSVQAELTVAEDALRRQQESSGIIDPIVVGKAQVERVIEIRGQLTELQIEQGALDQLLSQVGNGPGAISVRQLAAFPTFIKSQAISQMLGQLGTLEAERLKLLAAKTEADPSVSAVEQSIKTIEGQLLPIAKSYSQSISTEHSKLQSALDTLQSVVNTLPKAAESSLRLQRDVLRLGQIYAVLQTQLVAARLAAIDEGGQARQLDYAQPARVPAFPEPVTTMSIGAGGGLVLGLVLALVLGASGKWARDPAEVERVSGIPSVRFDPAEPLMVSSAGANRTILVLPLDRTTKVDLIAQRLAATAATRTVQPAVLDLTGRSRIVAPNDVNAMIQQLEQQHGLVIVELPELTTDTAAAALDSARTAVIVASSRRVDRRRLADTLQTLKRLEVPCAGIVLVAETSRNGLVTS